MEEVASNGERKGGWKRLLPMGRGREDGRGGFQWGEEGRMEEVASNGERKGGWKRWLPVGRGREDGRGGFQWGEEGRMEEVASNGWCLTHIHSITDRRRADSVSSCRPGPALHDQNESS